MPDVLKIKNQEKPEIILSVKDFEILIDERLGMDCARFYHEQISMLSDFIKNECLDWRDAGIILRDYGFFE